MAGTGDGGDPSGADAALAATHDAVAAVFREEAGHADEQALRLTGNPAERALLEQRLTLTDVLRSGT
jgi:hypothetical protein